MKIINKISDFLFGLLKLLIVLVILGLLLFIVQSRIKHLYATAIDPALANKSIVEVFQNQLPVVETFEDEKTPQTETSTPREMTEIQISEGQSVRDIGNQLKEMGFIEDVDTFIQKTRDMNAYPYFKAGTFQVAKDADNEELINVLTRDEKEKASGTFEITLPGSCTTAQVADILLAQNLIQSKDAFIKEVQNMGAEGKFIAGTHVIHGPIKTADLIRTLCSDENLKTEE